MTCAENHAAASPQRPENSFHVDASMAQLHFYSRTDISQRARMAGGQPISQLMAKALTNPTLISLAAGFVDPATLPVDTAQAAIADLMSRRDTAQAALQYGTTLGHPPLREAIFSATPCRRQPSFRCT